MKATKGRYNNLRYITLALVIIFPIVSCTNKNTDLIQVVEQGDLAEVTELIQAGADVNAKDKDGTSVLMIACQITCQ